jgi:hypothetical protein
MAKEQSGPVNDWGPMEYIRRGLPVPPEVAQVSIKAIADLPGAKVKPPELDGEGCRNLDGTLRRQIPDLHLGKP